MAQNANMEPICYARSHPNRFTPTHPRGLQTSRRPRNAHATRPTNTPARSPGPYPGVGLRRGQADVAIELALPERGLGRPGTTADHSPCDQEANAVWHRDAPNVRLAEEVERVLHRAVWARRRPLVRQPHHGEQDRTLLGGEQVPVQVCTDRDTRS